MKLGTIEPFAQDIVDATAPLVGGRTINIMDTSGIIVASSDKSRVGSFHQGAAEVLERCTTVRIYPKDLSRYPGAKEGINMPVIKDGQLLCVVGILGNPDEVQDAANLLGVCVGLYFDQASAAQQGALHKELRVSQLGKLVSGTFDGSELEGIKLRLPVRVLNISFSGSHTVAGIRRLNRIDSFLEEKGEVGERDVYSIFDDTFVLLKHMPSGFHIGNYAENLCSMLKAEFGITPIITIGSTAHDWEAISSSYREAIDLTQLCPPGCHDIETSECKALYLMGSVKKSAMKRFIAPMYQTLVDTFGEDVSWIAATIEAYCSSGYSVTKASQLLHIHKNTLVYRIKKAVMLMGLEEAQQQTKAFFLKEVLIYHKQHLSSKL